MSKSKNGKYDVTVIKKYANRRLYDTEKSSYITLEDLAEMIREKRDFVVVDAKSGEDLTRSVLTQIIVDQESKGENLLPINFLKEMIGFYGKNMGGILPSYLEHSIDAFAKNQEQFTSQIGQFNKSVEDIWSLQKLEDINKSNMKLFEQTVKAMSSFSSNNKK